MRHMMLIPMLRMSCLTNKGYCISRRCRSAWLLVGLSWRPKSKYNLKAIIKSKQPKQQLQPHQPCLSVHQSAFLCIRQSNRHNIFWILSTEAIVYDRAFIPSFRFCSTFSFLVFLFLQILKRFFNSHLLCFKGSYASFLLGRFLVLPGISVMNRRLSVMTDTCLEEEYFITHKKNICDGADAAETGPEPEPGSDDTSSVGGGCSGGGYGDYQAPRPSQSFDLFWLIFIIFA